MLRQYADFVFFREQMTALNEIIRQDTVRRVLDCQRRASEADRAEAMDLPAVLEEGERVILEAETAKRCERYRALFGVSGAAELTSPRIGVTGSVGSLPSLSPLGASAARVAVRGGRGAILRPVPGKF
jgi:hypothetical protein